ncbi:MAG: hypothetical protein VX498_02720 [Myxococcota bacterium]|nr:hypothetical protein [Myxococcota bacterium]
MSTPSDDLPGAGSPHRLELVLALALVGIAGGPFLFGEGVDFPDDAIIHSLPLWEWLKASVQAGHSPWFVLGKLGGVSLAGDSVPMGPFYPACWLLFVLPARHALPLAMLLHALGTVLTVRWLARTMGVSPRFATLAGAGVVLGTTGVFSFIDCQSDTMPLFLWFPAVIACLEHLDRASERRTRIRWACLAAGALGLLLLGSHLRWAAATGASLVLWCLLRRLDLRWVAGVLGVGLAGGLPGFLPQLLEWRQSAVSTERLSLLSEPAHNWVDLWNLAGILAPKAIHLEGDYSVGLVLGGALILGGWQLRGPLGRLAILAGLLYATPLSTEIPLLRYLFAPLLLLTHPVNHFYAALATIPAAVAGAACLDRRLGEGRPETDRARRLSRSFLALLIVLLLARCVPDLAFDSDYEWSIYLLAAAQALGLGALLFLLLHRAPRHRGRLLVVIALLDLALIGLRLHLALPATPIPWAERSELDTSPLNGGYVHLTELADLEPFQYEAQRGDAEADARVATDAETIRQQSAMPRDQAQKDQEDLLGRRWPIHIGLSRGLRSASGTAKMPPRRAVAMLTPRADALVDDPEQRQRLEDSDPERIPDLFVGAGAVGNRTLALFGIPLAVGPDETRYEVTGLVPPCYLPQRSEVVADEQQRIERLLSGPERPQDLALLEQAQPATFPPEPGTNVDCSSPGEVIVSAGAPTLIVLRERHHPGWTLRSETGEAIPLFPVNQVHLGAILEGEQRLTFRFVPPGLLFSMASSGAAWCLLFVALLRNRTRRRT